MAPVFPAIGEEFHAHLRVRRADFMGLTGGIKAVGKGTLTLLVGDQRESLGKVLRPVEIIAQRVCYVERVGLDWEKCSISSQAI